MWPETSASIAVYQNDPSIDCRYIDFLSDQQSFEEKALFGQRGLFESLWHCYTDPIELMHWQCKGAFLSIVVTHTLSAHLAIRSSIVQSTVCKFSHSASLPPSTVLVTDWTPPCTSPVICYSKCYSLLRSIWFQCSHISNNRKWLREMKNINKTWLFSFYHSYFASFLLAAEDFFSFCFLCAPARTKWLFSSSYQPK